MTGNAADAEDAFQETFVRVVRKRASYSGRGTWKSWLYAIALNVGRSGLRRAARKRIAVPLEKEPVSPPPSDEVEREDERRRVASAVRKLPQPQREVVVLKVYEDMSFPEIAATLERPVGTVKSQMRYALQRLRNEL
jgi:RNA polymerase sigma-70 factor (ECF subfamily)